MSVSELVGSCPAGCKALLPPLRKALEFDGKYPAVAYYLRSYAAHLGITHRNPSDKEAQKFLMALLTVLEDEKNKLAGVLEDGKLTLTKMALMLFSKADDMERGGQASAATVQLFVSSALIFDATQQFGEMDAQAKEKVKYAKYTALQIKKALDAGQPYVSPNPSESVPSGPEADAGIPTGAQFSQPQTSGPPAQQQYGQSTPPPPTESPPSMQPNLYGYPQGMQPPSGAYGQPHTQQHQQHSPATPTSPPTQQPQAQGPAGGHNIYHQHQHQGHQGSVPPSYQQYSAPDAQYGAPQQPSAHSSSASNESGYPQQQPVLFAQQLPHQHQQQQQQQQIFQQQRVPSMEKIIEAQKFAKQAVAALQFYDHQNAKLQLQRALDTLNNA